MVPVGEESTEEANELHCNIVKSCDVSALHELTGDVGDVILLHPLTVHSASKNGRRLVRMITNPNICLKEPFKFNRQKPHEHSLVELKTIQDIGRDKLQHWQITGKRAPIIPDRLQEAAVMLEDENKRLEAECSD